MNKPEPIPLTALEARITPSGSGHTISFVCPKCREHRLHIWRTIKGELETLTVEPWRSSTFTQAPCGVVHFFILDGQVVPAGSCGGWDD